MTGETMIIQNRLISNFHFIDSLSSINRNIIAETACTPNFVTLGINSMQWNLENKALFYVHLV